MRPEPGEWRWGWILALSGGVMVAFGTMLYAASVLLTDRAAGGEFSTTTLSAGYGGSVLIGGLLAYRIGRRADRAGVKALVVGGFAAGAAGMAVLAAARSPWQVLLAFWVLIGPAGGLTFYEPAFVAVHQWFAPHLQARSVATLTVIGGLAGPIFLPVAAGLVDLTGWRGAAAILAGGMAVTGVIAALALPGGTGGVTGPDRRHTPLRTLIADRRFVRFTAATLLAYAGFQAILFHRIAVFEEAGATVATAAAWAAAAGLLSFPGRWAGPYLTRHLDGVLMYAGLTAASGAATLVMLGGSGWAMPAHFATFGVVLGATLPVRAVVMAQWYPGGSYGSAMGAQWTVASVGGAALPAVAGAVHDATGSYTWAVVLIAVVFACASLAAAATRRVAGAAHPEGAGIRGSD